MSEAMIVNVTINNFQEMVMQNSKRLPVLINFWSPLNEQSKLANTILEKLAEEMAGKFILAKVLYEQQTEIVEKLAVPNPPFYKLIKDANIVTEQAGLLSESAYREMLNAHIEEAPSEILRKQAGLAFADGEYDQAIQLLGEAAKTDPNNFKIHLDLVQMYLHTGHLDKAKNLFEKLPEEAQKDPQGKELDGILYFSEAIAQVSDIQAIQAALAEDPNDCHALHALAGYLILNGQVENALQTLFKLFTIDRTYQDGLAQKSIIKAFEMLTAKAPELVTAYRRKFQSLLY
ncbi:MAG TPA: tetratricopeptide repeat protein [Thiomicrospira sp.]|jgi:putative thioredoxin|nr:tetratricopeptide repeat protein [Thiomicrospira sp.]